MSFDRHRVEAQLALDLIVSCDMPKMACEALAAGLDGSALRRLAGLEKPTSFETAEVLPEAFKEMGLSSLTVGEAAKRLARLRIAEILGANFDPLLYLRELESMWVKTGYPRETRLVGTLYDEVWKNPGWSESETRDWVIKQLKMFMLNSR